MPPRFSLNTNLKLGVNAPLCTYIRKEKMTHDDDGIWELNSMKGILDKWDSSS